MKEEASNHKLSDKVIVCTVENTILSCLSQEQVVGEIIFLGEWICMKCEGWSCI